MSDEHSPELVDDLYTLKLDLAVAYGHSGDRAIDFASRLRGETAEDLTADAATLAAALTSLAPPAPPVGRAVDPSQGRSMEPEPITPADELLNMLKLALGKDYR